MTDLITRLEQAGEHPRTLDAWVAGHIGKSVTWKDIDGYTEDHDGPHYTTSLDAALTLLKDPDIRIGIWHGTARAALNPHTNIVDSGLIYGKNAAARAVCIAALRAKE